MIVTRLIGGLGNQMFQYAAGLALATRLNVDLKTDLSAFDQYSLHQYSLDHLSVDAQQATVDERPSQIQSSWPKRLVRDLRSIGKPAVRIYREASFRFDANFLTLPDGVYLDGYWQSERYFASVASLVRKQFAVRTPPSPENVEWLAQISSVRAVSIHVRRGDYARNPATQAIHGLCAPEYYARAVALMTERVGSNIELFVFSDDPNWVRDNLNFRPPTHYIACNDAARNYEDLRLMGSCRHHIIANSTFSWWGAWLNPSADKLIIAPRRWFQDPSLEDSDLIPADWQRL